MREIKIIEMDTGIEVMELWEDKGRGVILTEKMDTLDFHLAKHAIRTFGEMITRHQSPQRSK